MSNSKQIIDSIVSDNLYQANKLIKEDLIAKMSAALEEKLVNYAPTIFNEATKSKPDFLDLDKDGNKKEPMKKAAKEAKNESVDSQYDNIVMEDFEKELKAIVEEIEEETGEELTEEEITQLANELLDVLAEEEEKDDEDDEDDEEDEEDEEEDVPVSKKSFNAKNTGPDAY